MDQAWWGCPGLVGPVGGGGCIGWVLCAGALAGLVLAWCIEFYFLCKRLRDHLVPY